MQLKSRFFWVAPIFLFALGLIGYVRQVPQVPDYIIMIDAGSTGSRLFIYPVGSSRISSVNSLIGRDLNGVIKKKVEPGLLQYRDDPQRAAESLQPLIEFALKNIPARNHHSTPIYLRATGGLRSLPQSNVDAILTSIRKNFAKLPFKVEDSHISVITGSEEALYGWVSLNFLLEADEPFGALDMGGSSTQISLTLGQTVAPSLCKHSVNYLDKSHQVCAISLQGFGLESAYQAYRQTLIEEADAKKNYVVKSPCLSKGHVEHVYLAGSPSNPKIGKITVTIIGEGNFDSCLGKLLPVLSQQKKAADPAIALLPALANENDFVAFNGFVQTHRALGLQRRPSLREWQEASREFCSLDWKDVEAKSQPANRCFKAAWLQLILHQVYGLSFEERRIDFVKEVSVSNSQWVEGSNIPETHNVEVSWTIGAVLLELASANMS